jgi:hypothetical protein
MSTQAFEDDLNKIVTRQRREFRNAIKISVAGLSALTGQCYQKAGEISGAAGYDIVQQVGEGGVYGQAGQCGGFGYRLQVRREGGAVRLFTRRGYDWSGRYPSIAVTAMLLRASHSRSMARPSAGVGHNTAQRAKASVLVD